MNAWHILLAFVEIANQILEFPLDFCQVKKAIGLGHGLNMLSQLVDIGFESGIMIVECPNNVLLYTFLDT